MSTVQATGLPLEGIKVLDLSRALAGPYATSLLGDLGAQIIKVEGRNGGDSSRSWPPFENEHSLYFDSVNRNKSSVAVDFYSVEGKKLLRRLAGQADVLVENFRPGVLPTMGLDPVELRKTNPGLVIASVSGFGTSGPLAQTAGLDQVAQAMSGLMSVTGSDSQNMYRYGVPIIDMSSGMLLSFAISSALVHRQRTGEGIDVSTSLLETALGLSAFQGQRYLSIAEVPEPQGNNHPVLSPYGVFQTADIPIIIAVGNDKQFTQLAHVLENPELLDDERYKTGRDRSVHRTVLAADLERLLAKHPGLHWLDKLREAKIPCGPIYNYAQVFEDEQVKAVDMIRTVHRTDGSELPLLRGPLSVNGQAVEIRKAPPALGEDTVAVLTDLGLSVEQISGLVDAGIVTALNQPESAAGAR